MPSAWQGPITDVLSGACYIGWDFSLQADDRAPLHVMFLPPHGTWPLLEPWSA